jgi:hypothetical protein
MERHMLVEVLLHTLTGIAGFTFMMLLPDIVRAFYLWRKPKRKHVGLRWL